MTKLAELLDLPPGVIVAHPDFLRGEQFGMRAIWTSRIVASGRAVVEQFNARLRQFKLLGGANTRLQEDVGPFYVTASWLISEFWNPLYPLSDSPFAAYRPPRYTVQLPLRASSMDKVLHDAQREALLHYMMARPVQFYDLPAQRVRFVQLDFAESNPAPPGTSAEATRDHDPCQFELPPVTRLFEEDVRAALLTAVEEGNLAVTVINGDRAVRLDVADEAAEHCYIQCRSPDAQNAIGCSRGVGR